MPLLSVPPSRVRAAVCVSLVCAAGAVAAADVPASADGAQNAGARTPPVVALHSGDAAEFASDSRKVTMQRHADGTRLYLMNGQGMEAMTAHIGADGKLELRCSDETADHARNAAAAEHADDR
jgi:hypothetical protein